MCEKGASLIAHPGARYALWEECRDNCKNICRDHKIAVMMTFADSVIARAKTQIDNGFTYDQSGKVTYYTHASKLDEAIERLTDFKASLKVDEEGNLTGGTKPIEYRDWLCAIYWQ